MNPFSVKCEQFLNKSVHLRVGDGSNRNTSLFDTDTDSNDHGTTPRKRKFICHSCVVSTLYSRNSND